MRVLIFFALLCFAAAGHAQDTIAFKPQYKTGLRYVIRTIEGEVLTGVVTRETRESITLEDRQKRKKEEIMKSAIIGSALFTDRAAFDDLVLGENPHRHYYMLSGSAFLFDKEKITAHSPWLLLDNMDYAFSENVALSANSIFFYPFSIGLKCAFQLNERTFIGGHAIVMGNINGATENIPGFWGYMALARITQGTSNRNLTLSGGVLGISSVMIPVTSPTPFTNLEFVSAAWCSRFSKKWAFNAEGWYMPRINTPLVGASFKFVGSEYGAWTLGCYAYVNTDAGLRINTSTLPIPFFGYTRKIN